MCVNDTMADAVSSFFIVSNGDVAVTCFTFEAKFKRRLAVIVRRLRHRADVVQTACVTLRARLLSAHDKRESRRIHDHSNRGVTHVGA